LAVVADRHAIPFLVAAPLAACDREAADGRTLRAELRPASELLSYGGRQIAPEGTAAVNPSVDIVPASLVSAIVTEAGAFRAPYGTTLDDAAAAAGVRAATTMDRVGAAIGPADATGPEA